MDTRAQCELCDLSHSASNLISNEPNCQHKACATCVASYVGGMNLFGMLSLGCWYNNCDKPLSVNVILCKDADSFD